MRNREYAVVDFHNHTQVAEVGTRRPVRQVVRDRSKYKTRHQGSQEMARRVEAR